MRVKPFDFKRVALVSTLPLLTLAGPWGCDREPGIIVDVAQWPTNAVRIRVRPNLNGMVDTDFFITRDQDQFVVRLPPDSQGTLQLDAVALDVTDCKLAASSLTEPVPTNLSRFVERTLEFMPLQSPQCVFENATSFPVGRIPEQMAVADFNNDMRPDLAVTNISDNTVSVFLGNGQGGFNFALNIAAGTSPSRLLTGDFDGNMKPDLAIANTQSASISVFLGNGQGGFNPATAPTITVGMNPVGVGIGDFDNNTHPDLVVANQGSNNISVFLGNGQGGFIPASVPTITVGTNPVSIAVGYFNSDTNLDLAVANKTNNMPYGTISVLLGNGQGGFAPAPTPTITVGKQPQWVEIGDFNNDKIVDLVVANLGSQDISVLLGKGQGTFVTTPNITGFSTPVWVTSGDFNNDKLTDLVVANSNQSYISVLLGNGQGGFGPAKIFDVGQHPYGITVGDFNRDMKPDLAVSNNTSNSVSILLNQF